MNDYFQTDLIKRKSLNEEQLQFITQVESILKEYAQQFDPADTILTSEGNGLIIMILRNKKLSNVSLVITYSITSIEIIWAQVNTLEYHDELDNGFSEKIFYISDYSNIKNRNDAVVKLMRQQLTREIYLKITYINSVPIEINYLIKIADNQFQKIGRKKLSKFRLIDLFKRKETKFFKSNILEKADNPKFS